MKNYARTCWVNDKMLKGNRFHTCALNDEFTWLLCGGFGGGSMGLCWDCCDSDLKNISRFVCNWKRMKLTNKTEKKKRIRMKKTKMIIIKIKKKHPNETNIQKEIINIISLRCQLLKNWTRQTQDKQVYCRKQNKLIWIFFILWFTIAIQCQYLGCFPF